MTDTKLFIEKLCEEFPDMSNDILDEDILDIFSLQIGVFRSYTQEAIDGGDFEKVDRYFNFLDPYLKNIYQKPSSTISASKIENSIVLSYIGKLDFKNYPKSKCVSKIQKGLQDYYDDSISQDDKLIK
ncbi:hypothetical protein [Bacteroides sp. 224]|uniref:DUF7674 family protein n=1 Tax=Bacteroides sp. 224 TaxID=2302936 RepID=UPI0013CF6651|nr:hypothetical protein [Bacteroides sp. 224]NDV66666.1 hypothetical protein [Bacteroides sp. 224]